MRASAKEPVVIYRLPEVLLAFGSSAKSAEKAGKIM
jgi:hypothetical protein